MSGTGDGRRREMLRLTVSGAADLVVQLPAGGDPAGDRGAGAAGEPAVEALPLTAEDEALGRRRFEVLVDGWRFEVAAEDARRAELRERALRAAAEHQPPTSVALRAQIPGRVTRVWAAAGESVEQGQRLLAIEAMKMENEVRAPRSGTVERVAVAEGQRVEVNDELLTLA